MSPLEVLIYMGLALGGLLVVTFAALLLFVVVFTFKTLREPGQVGRKRP